MKVKFTQAGLIPKRIVTIQTTTQELMQALQASYGTIQIDVNKPHVIYRLEVS